jgi:type II secretory pathway pseudopilin PulG
VKAARKALARVRGYTIIETLVAATIFSVVGYALLLAVRLGAGSQQEVIRVATESQSLRDSTRKLSEELRQANDSQITVTELPDGNSELTFRHGIEIGGNYTWGVHDKSLGSTVEDQTKENWSVRYTVVENDVNGVVRRELVRQLLDDEATQQQESVLVSGLCSGAADKPGFLVEDGGAVWVLTVSVDSKSGSKGAKSMVVHVNTIN